MNVAGEIPQDHRRSSAVRPRDLVAVPRVGDALVGQGVSRIIEPDGLAEILVAPHAAAVDAADGDKLRQISTISNSPLNRRAIRQKRRHGLGHNRELWVLHQARLREHALALGRAVFLDRDVVVDVPREERPVVGPLQLKRGVEHPVEADLVNDALLRLLEQDDDAVRVGAHDAAPGGLKALDQHQQAELAGQRDLQQELGRVERAVHAPQLAEGAVDANLEGVGGQLVAAALGLKAARNDALVNAQEVLAHLVGRQLQLQDDRRVVAGHVEVGERLVPGGHDGALALARMQAANTHLVVRLADPDLGLRQPLGHAQRAVRSDDEAALQNAPVDVLQVLLLKPDNAGTGVAHHAARIDLLGLVTLACQSLQFVLDDGLGHLRVALRAQVDGVLLAHLLSEIDHALQFSVEHLRRVHVVLAIRLQVGALFGRDQLVGLDREVLHRARVHAPAVNFQADLSRRDIDHVDVIPRSDVDALIARHAPRRKIALDDLVGEVFELRAVRAVNCCGENDQVVAETIEADRCV